MMKVFICKSHDGHCLDGQSIIVADTIDEAKLLLDEALVEAGLKPSNDRPYELEAVDLSQSHVIILNNGEY